MRKLHLKAATLIMTAIIMTVPCSNIFAASETEQFSDGNEYQVVMDNAENQNEARGIFTTKYRVTASALNVRSGPGTGYSVIGSLSKGQVIKVKSISQGWAKFTFNGQNGYVKADYLEKV